MSHYKFNLQSILFLICVTKYISKTYFVVRNPTYIVVYLLYCISYEMSLYEGLNYLISQCYSKIQNYLRNVNLITQTILHDTVENLG